jgi:hypothetical protein
LLVDGAASDDILCHAVREGAADRRGSVPWRGAAATGSTGFAVRRGKPMFAFTQRPLIEA